MKKVIVLMMTIFSLRSYSLPNSDCALSGQGSVFIFDAVTNTYVKDDVNSYSLAALRFPLGEEKYLYQETKSFSDGRPNQITMFKQTNSVGSFNFSALDGCLKSAGVCTRAGHCFGVIVIPAVNFKGRMTTDFDSKSILTVTFSDDGSFVDEVLMTSQSCP